MPPRSRAQQKAELERQLLIAKNTELDALKKKVRLARTAARRRGVGWEPETDKEFVERLGEDDYMTGYRFTALDTPMSLDRLDPEKGYVPDNVVACDPLVNLMKGSYTPGRFLHHLNRIIAHMLPDANTDALVAKRPQTAVEKAQARLDNFKNRPAA
jgi:hypothetical protein